MNREISAVLLVFCLSVSVAAQEWVPVDSRSKGIGNAGVGITDGAVSGFNNPAALGANVDEPFAFFSAGFGLTVYAYTDTALEGDVIGALDTINDLFNELGSGAGFQDVQDKLNNGTANEQDLQDAVKLINSITDLDDAGLGVVLALGGGVDMRMGSFGLFYRTFAYGAIDPFLNLGDAAALSDEALGTFFGQFSGGADPPDLTVAGQNLRDRIVADTSFGSGTDNDTDSVPDANELAYQAQVALGDVGISDPAFQDSFILTIQATLANAGGSPGETIGFNGSGFQVRGMILQETGISFGLPLNLLPLPGMPSMSIGVSVKEVIAETFNQTFTLSQLTSGENILQEILDSRKQNTIRSTESNLDIGLAMQPIPLIPLTLGITAHNLFPMEFDLAGTTDTLKVDPQYRFGASFNIPGLGRIAADIDLSKNKFDGLKDFKSRMLAGGIEIDVLPVKFRLGAFHNLSSDNTSAVYTGGIGLHILGFMLDINGQVSAKRIPIENPSKKTETLKIPERVSLSATLGFNLGF